MTTGADQVERTSALHLVAPAGAEVGSGDSPRPLVRELEDLVDRMHRYGPTPRLLTELDQLLRAWADALVAVHRRPVTALTPDAALPWVLEDPLPAWLETLDPVGRSWAALAHPEVTAALCRARAAWSPVQATHPDPSGDAVVVLRRGGVVTAALRTEPLACGDPRWDVATVLDWLAVAFAPVLDPSWRLDPAARFLVQYEGAGGDARPTASMAVARTLATAIEWTAQLCLADAAGPSGGDPERLPETGPGVEAEAAELRAWVSGLWERPLALASAGTPATGVRRVR